MGLSDLVWEDLLDSVGKKKCTAFVGAGASSPWIPVGRNIANEWARTYKYPLEDSSQLSRVAQFVAITGGGDLNATPDESTPKRILSRKLEKISPPNFSLEKYRNTPYAVLADLNLPIYITTNYDHFLEEALKSKGKHPVSEFCVWNKGLEDYMKDLQTPSAFKNTYTPTESNPLVYHLHGDIHEPGSMVLTQRDYLKFVIHLSKWSDVVLPRALRTSLATTTLLFVGYSLEDENFLTIFEGVVNLVTPLGSRKSIAVQFSSSEIDSTRKDQVENYLEEYTRHMFQIHVYWGDASAFSKELRKRLDKFKSK